MNPCGKYRIVLTQQFDYSVFLVIGINERMHELFNEEKIKFINVAYYLL